VVYKNTKEIEKQIQERVLRFIYVDYHNVYEVLLKISNLPSLKGGRMPTIR